jgi:hypothetical protein
MPTHNKLSAEIINNRIKQSDIVMTGDLVNVKTKTMFKHVVCGHSWLARPHKVMQGTSCPRCYGKPKLSIDIINKRLDLLKSETIMIGEYKSIKQKSLFRHLPCGTEWLAVPHSIINGKGCPTCAKYGFNFDKNAYLYIIKYEKFIKYGITNSLDRRLYEHKMNGDFEILKTINFKNGKDAAMYETKIKKRFGGNFVGKNECKNGYTETLPLSVLNDLSKFLENI